MAIIAQINVNPDGGVPKRAVPHAHLRVDGVEGDRQRDLRYHGGPSRAVSLYSVERLSALAAEGHPIGPGSAGENLTLEGLDWDRLGPGVRLRLGAAAEIEITSYAAPCKTIAHCLRGRDLRPMSQKTHPGWSRLYAKILIEGLVAVGDSVEVIAHAS